MAKDEDILARLTATLEEMYTNHPRKNGRLSVGMWLTVHDEETRRSFTATIVSVDPLRINWRY
jgi:transcription elongation GreA/GreB family factor